MSWPDCIIGLEILIGWIAMLALFPLSSYMGNKYPSNVIDNDEDED